jgi:hypothetical protein
MQAGAREILPGVNRARPKAGRKQKAGGAVRAGWGKKSAGNNPARERGASVADEIAFGSGAIDHCAMEIAPFAPPAPVVPSMLVVW